MTKINNIVLTPLQECYEKEALNFFIGPWCENSNLKKFNYEIIKHSSHHWSDKTKMLSDYEYLKLFYDKLIPLFSKELNKLHSINEDKRYWELILGPWLFTMIPLIFDRWEVIRTFIAQNPNVKFQTIVNKNKNLKFEYTTDIIRPFAYKDNFNLYLFSEIIKKYYKNIKIYEIDGFFEEFKEKKKNHTLSKLSFIFIKIFSFINKIQFDAKSMRIFDFLKLCISLRSFPFTTLSLFSIFQNNFLIKKKFDVNRNKIENNIISKFNKPFEKFCVNFLIETMPQCFLENFIEIKKKIDELSSKQKTFFSNFSILSNDIYRFWVANSKKNSSILITNAHGGFIPFKKNSFNYENSISDRYLTWHKKSAFSNSFQIFPLRFLNKKERNMSDNKSKKKIGFVDIELSRYFTRAVSWLTSTEYQDEKKETNKIFSNLTESYFKNNFVYRCLGNFGWNNNKKIQSINKKIKISKISEESFGNFLEECFLTLHRYPSTPFSECLYRNIPSLLFFNENSYLFDDQYLDLFKQLKQKKIYYNDVSDLCNFMKQDKDKILDWWYSKQIQDFRLVLLDKLCKKPDNWIKDLNRAIYR